MKKEIVFSWDTEKRIRVAQAGQEQSLFYEAYRQALAGVAEIVRFSIMYEREYTYDPFIPREKGDAPQAGGKTGNGRCVTCDHDYLYDYPNNIIVFSGERGAGKSSAMLTFVNSLKDQKGLLFQKEFLDGMVACELPSIEAEEVKKMLWSCRFIELSPIDPTSLENDVQILTVILARMFRLMSATWENEHNRLGRESFAQRLEQKDQLIQKFSTCYEHIQAIKRESNSKSEYEDLDTLAELGDSSRLKVELYELVDLLLRFCLPEAGDSSYLVLQIDDTDMNIKQAYALLEDVRRYLVIPRVIIVMAADLKHLTQVVESSLLKDYDQALDSRCGYVEEITHQYITKLFPQTRQIDLPSLGTYFKEHTENITIKYEIEPDNCVLPDKMGDEFPDSQEQIFRLIYRKTGMVFLKQEHRLHPIIPCNMRLLAHFLSMLIQMKDVDDPDAEEPGFFLRKADAEHTYEEHGKKLRTRLQNVQRFRSYFLASWVTNNLNAQSAQLFKELEQTDIADRVPYICAQLTRLTKSADEGSDGAKGGNAFTGECYADMVAMCREISDHSWDEELKRLAFAFQAYCSVLAHTLALEDLIDYYDEYASYMQKLSKEPEGGQENEDGNKLGPKTRSTGLGCSFSRLYLLFGSHLFPYNYEGEDKTAWAEIPPFGNDKTPKNEQMLGVSWFSENKISFEGLQAETKPYAVLLYSMLGEYQSQRNAQKVRLDLTSPIINCLYLGDYNDQTPFTESICKESLTVDIIGRDNWQTMGNSALTTVLNCDVQMKVGAVLQDRILVPNDKTEVTKYGVWVKGIMDLYSAMSSAIGTRSPIRFLKSSEDGSIDLFKFSGWLDELTSSSIQKRVEKLEQKYQNEKSKDAFRKQIEKDWASVIKGLGLELVFKLERTQDGGKSTASVGAASDPMAESVSPTEDTAKEQEQPSGRQEENAKDSSESGQGETTGEDAAQQKPLDDIEGSEKH